MVKLSRLQRNFIWLALLILAVLGGRHALERMAPPGVPPGFLAGNGRLETVEADVSTKLAGRVTELIPREGDQVTAGQRVAKLDARDLEAQLDEAKAGLAQALHAQAEAKAGMARADADLSLARATLRRTEQLVAVNFLSADRADRDRSAVTVAVAAREAARTRLEQSAASIKAAEARIARIRTTLEDTELKSPINGRVLYRLVEPGEVLGAGGKLLTVLDMGEVYMTVFVPSETAGKVNIGGEARIALDALPDVAIPARVEFIASRAQFTPREVETRSEREKLMFRAKLRVDPQWVAAHADMLKPGMPGVGWIRVDAAQAWPEPLPRL